METPIKQPITPERQAGKPGIDDPNYSGNPMPEKDPDTYEVPERDPSPNSVPKDLPPDPERDPDSAGHDIEVEGP
jgi:hypothetical protein